MDEAAVLKLRVAEGQGGIAFVIRGNPQPVLDLSVPIDGVHQESVATHPNGGNEGIKMAGSRQGKKGPHKVNVLDNPAESYRLLKCQITKLPCPLGRAAR